MSRRSWRGTPKSDTRSPGRSEFTVESLSWETSTVDVRPSAVRNVMLVPATDCTVPSTRHIGSAGTAGGGGGATTIGAGGAGGAGEAGGAGGKDGASAGD